MERAILRTGEFDHAVPHDGPPEVDGQIAAGRVIIAFVGIGDSVIHQSEGKLRQIVKRSRAFAEGTGLHIALTFPRSQKDVPAASPADHSFGHFMMLVFVTVSGQLRPVHVPFKMRLHLIAALFQIGVVGQVVAAGILNRANALDLHLDGVHHPHPVDHPQQRRLPVHAFQNPFERFIGRHLIGTLFPADAQDRVGKKTIVARDLEGHDIRMFHVSTSLSFF